MADTVRVAVGFNGETERAYARECDPGDTDDYYEEFEFDVSAELWRAVENAGNAWREAMDAVVAATDYDEDQGRVAQCCPSWQGDVHQGREWWAVVIPASDDADTWPRIPLSMRHCDSEQAALDLIASLPESMWCWPGAGPAVPVARDALYVERGGYRGSVTACWRCGWPRDEHADPGSPDESEPDES